MKASVIKHYTDRLTRELHMAGTTVELSAERFAELNAKGYVAEESAREAQAEPEPAPAAEPAQTPAGEPEGAAGPDLEAMTKRQLKELAAARGVKVGSKATNAKLVAAIEAAL